MLAYAARVLASLLGLFLLPAAAGSGRDGAVLLDEVNVIGVKGWEVGEFVEDASGVLPQLFGGPALAGGL